MSRLLLLMSIALPLLLSGCTSYGVHLYTDPHHLRVVEERVVLTDADAEPEAGAFAVLMRGDSVVVIGERRNNWEYEQDLHDRWYIVYFNSRRAYVPHRALVTLEQYASMYGPGRVPAADISRPSSPDAGTGSVSDGDTLARPVQPADDPQAPPKRKRR